MTKGEKQFMGGGSRLKSNEVNIIIITDKYL